MLIYRRSAELLEADVANEIVALEPTRGECFGFNEVASTVWRHLSKPQSFDDLHAHLVSEYDVGSDQCAAELRELLRDLLEKRLITTGV